MNDWNTRLTPTTGWQMTLVGFEVIAMLCFLYLLIKKITSKRPYTHFEGKLYWASIIILLANLFLYMYGNL